MKNKILAIIVIFIIIISVTTVIQATNNSSYINNNFENNLSILRINRAGIIPNFNPNIKEYYIIIGEEIYNLEVTAVPENEENKVIITGNTNLKNGLNTISIKVVDKNENETEYKIYVTKTSNTENANANLENLAVENYELSPNFQKQVLNYKLEVDENIDKLNILAIPENYNSTVEVTGNDGFNNENLKQGKQVTITVTAPNKTTFQKYQIMVYRKDGLANNESESNILNNEINNEEVNNTELFNEISKIENSIINSKEINAEKLSNSREIELTQKQKLQIMIKQGGITIIGIIASIIVLGIVIILIYRKKKV